MVSQLVQHPGLRLPWYPDPLQRWVRAGLCFVHMKRKTRALLSDTTRLIVWPNRQDKGLTRLFWWDPGGGLGRRVRGNRFLGGHCAARYARAHQRHSGGSVAAPRPAAGPGGSGERVNTEHKVQSSIKTI